MDRLSSRVRTNPDPAGRYSESLRCFSTRRRVSAETSARSLSTFDTVATETPAASATSARVVRCFGNVPSVQKQVATHQHFAATLAIVIYTPRTGACPPLTGQQAAFILSKIFRMTSKLFEPFAKTSRSVSPGGSMTTPRTSRRTFLGFAAGSALGAFGLSACGTSGPAQPGGAASAPATGGGAGGTASMWALTGQPNQGIREDSVEAFNKLGKGSIEPTFFQNDPYKAKIRTAVGAGQAPTIIFGWGGGILKSYADAGQVDDLTSWIGENAGFKDKFIPAVWKAATIDDKIYAVPIQNTQPIVMYYNKTLFEKAGAQPPATWDDVMNLVNVFNGQGVAPFSLGGQSKWTSMMWLEYLFDRIGGPEVFDAIYANKPDSWSDPAVIESCTKVQELVKANGFIKGFSSIAADTNADWALLYTGKAAMMLHGGWAYGGMKEIGRAHV